MMLTYEQQTKKLLSKRQAVLDRIESDKAEIEKINAKLNAIQLAKIRDALGCDEQGLFELITKHPEQLAKLKQESTAKSDTAQDSDESELIGQTSFFDEKSFKD
jgi:phage repressor protein C with HTH and peptisase S24 domain